MPTDILSFTGSQAPGEVTVPRPGSAAPDYAFYRAATATDYFAWLEHVRPAAGCAHPIRLSGEVATVERDTGRLLASVSTQDMPDGQITSRAATAAPRSAPRVPAPTRGIHSSSSAPA